MEKTFEIKQLGEESQQLTWKNKTYSHDDPRETINRTSEPEVVEYITEKDVVHYTTTNRPLIEVLDNTLANKLFVDTFVKGIDKGFVEGFEFVNFNGNAISLTRGIAILNSKVIDFKHKIYKGKIEDLTDDLIINVNTNANQNYFLMLDDEGNFSSSTTQDNNKLLIGIYSVDSMQMISGYSDKRSKIRDLNVSDDDVIKNKFLSNAQAKNWEDRISSIESGGSFGTIQITTQSQLEYWFGNGSETGIGQTTGGWNYEENGGIVKVTIPEKTKIIFSPNPTDGTTMHAKYDIVNFPYKAYTINVSVKAKSGVILKGNGRSQTIIKKGQQNLVFETDYILKKDDCYSSGDNFEIVCPNVDDFKIGQKIYYPDNTSDNKQEYFTIADLNPNNNTIYVDKKTGVGDRTESIYVMTTDVVVEDFTMDLNATGGTYFDVKYCFDFKSNVEFINSGVYSSFPYIITNSLIKYDFRDKRENFLLGQIAAFPVINKIGWLLCDGRTLHPTDASADIVGGEFTELYNLLYNSGSSGLRNGTFAKLPDLRGRSLMGVGSILGLGGSIGLAQNLGNGMHTHGDETEPHTLTIDEIPSHNHGGATGSNNVTHSHGYSTKGGEADDGTGYSADTWWSNSDAGYGYHTVNSTSINHTHSIQTQGGGQGHIHLINEDSSVHPVQGFYYLIKY